MGWWCSAPRARPTRSRSTSAIALLEAILEAGLPRERLVVGHRLLRAHRHACASPAMPSRSASPGCSRCRHSITRTTPTMRSSAVFDQVIQRVGDKDFSLYLYHFPQPVRRADHARPARAPGRPPTRTPCRREGQLGRLEHDQIADRALPGAGHLSRRRDPAPAGAAGGRRRLHQRVLQRQRARRSAGFTTITRRTPAGSRSSRSS